MNKDVIKLMVRMFRNVDYKDLFGALILNEKIDYLQDLEDLSDADIKYLEELFDRFMQSDNMTLINSDLLDVMEGLE